MPGPARSRGSYAFGFFSSVRTLSLEPGALVEPGRVRGYAIDFRSKAVEPRWPPDWLPETRLHVAVTQWALGSFEHYLHDGREAWLDAARQAAGYLLDRQTIGGRQDGGFVHDHPYPHTFRLAPGWLSGITQGQAASLFVRLHAETGDDRLAEAAVRALAPFDVPSREGGVQALLGGRPLPEEYPTDPPSHVLNGGLFALFGSYDVAVGLARPESQRQFDELADTFAQNLGRWDTGYWSRYDLYPHRRMNVASSAYHHLHISQLSVLARLSPAPQFARFRDRFREDEGRASARWRAFAAKVGFRLAVPRFVRP